MLKKFGLFSLLLVVLGVSGCVVAPTKIPVSEQFLNNKTLRVGLVVTPLPEFSMSSSGSQGLLDVAINQGMAKKIKEHLQNASFEPFDKPLEEQFINYITNNGYSVKTVELDIATLTKFNKPKKKPKNVQFYQKDLMFLKEKENIDVLVLIETRAVGTIRSYYGFFPTSDPKGYYSGLGSMINLSDNSLLWSSVNSQEIQIKKPWDQEPNYPNLTQAVDEALERAKAKYKSDFTEKSVAKNQ